MKVAIVALLLVAVVGVFSEPQINIGANVGIGGAAAKGGKNLSAQDIAEIQAILTKIVGTKLSGGVTKLVATLVNGALGKIPLRGVLHSVTGLLFKLLKDGGVVEKLLGGGNANAAKGPNAKNLTPADQAQLTAILNRTVGPFTSKFIVKTVATTVDGLLGKIPLGKLLHGVTGLVGKLLKPNALVGKLVGQKGLGKPVSQILGAPGKVLGGLGL